MKTPLSLISFFCLSAASAFPQGSSHVDNQESGYYEFYGAEILAYYRNNAQPIVSTDKKGIYVDIGKKKPKRLSWNTFCATQPIVEITNRLIQVSKLNLNSFYQKESRYAGRGYDAIRQKKDETDLKIAELRTVAGVVPGAEDAIQKLELERDMYTSNMEESMLNKELNQEGIGDSIQVEMTLTPDADYENPFCAVVAEYQNLKGERRVAIKLSRLGALQQDITETKSFAVFLGEGDFKQSRFEVHLYTENGALIATNRSPRLRMLSVDELVEATRRLN